MNATTELFATSVAGRQPLGPRVTLDVVDEREVCSQRGDVLRRGQPQVEDDRARRQLDRAGREVAGAVQGHRPAVEPGALRRRGADGQAGGDRPLGRHEAAQMHALARSDRAEVEELLRHPAARAQELHVDGVLVNAARERPFGPLPCIGVRAGARERVLGRGPRPQRTRPEGRLDAVLELPRLHGRARGRCQVAPVVLERRFDLDLPLAVERHLARRRRHDRSGGLAPHPPREQRARPVGEVQPHPDAALDRLARGGAPAARERLPHLHVARHAREHDVHRARVIGGIEPVADPLRPRVLHIRGGQLDHGRAREDRGDEQEPGVPVGPQQRRHRRLHPARHGLQHVADRVRLIRLVGGARGEPRGKLGVRGQRPDGDQRPARVDELSQALGRARLEHRAAGQHDRGVGLAADPQLAVTHARRGDAVVVEDVEIACQPVEHAGTRVEPAHATDDVEVERLRAPAGLARPVEPERRARSRGGQQHADLARVVPPGQRRAQAGDGARERLVVPPVRLAPVRGGRRPFPPARTRRVVGRVRVVEVRPRADPGQQPVEGLLQRPAPARGVERLDPHPRTVVVMGDRRVELGVAVVVRSGGAEPPVGAHVVAVDLARRDRLALARADLLVHPAQEPVALVPLVQRPEERPLRQRAAHPVVVAAEPRPLLTEVLPQRREVRERVVSGLGDEPLVEVGRPRGHVRQLVLERARDHRAEQVADPLLEAAVHHREQPPARARGEVVEAALDDVEEHQSPATAEARHPSVEHGVHQLAVARHGRRRDRHPARRALRASARRRPRRPRARASGPHAPGGAAPPGPGSSRPRSRSGRRTTRARRAPARRGTRPRTAPTMPRT